jgi:hypothetical protein
VQKPVAPPSLPVEISASQVRVKEYSSNLAGNKEEKETVDFLPVLSDKFFDLHIEGFIPKLLIIWLPADFLS